MNSGPIGLFFILSIVKCLPVQPPKDMDSSEYDVVYLPYDIKYIPVEIPADSKKLFKNSKNHAFIADASNEAEKKSISDRIRDNLSQIKSSRDDLASNEEHTDLVMLPLSELQTEINSDSKLTKHHQKGSEGEQELVLVPLSSLKQNQKELPEELILVPKRILQNGENQNFNVENKELRSKEDKTNDNLSRKVKRQAPGNSLFFRPVVRFRRVFRSTRRVQRRPPLVGYLRDDADDNFPTVA